MNILAVFKKHQHLTDNLIWYYLLFQQLQIGNGR